jgi:hypothetical protein
MGGGAQKQGEVDMLIKNFVRRGILGLLFAAVTASANAQGQLKVTPNNPSPGERVAVEYSNPNRAGQTITVNISDGEGHSEQVQIPLDGAGKGSRNWVVPNWTWAIFSSLDADDVIVFVGGG